MTPEHVSQSRAQVPVGQPPGALDPPEVPEGPKAELVVGPTKDLMALRVDTVADADAVFADGIPQAIAEESGAVVIVLVGGVRLENLDDETMAKYGWVRAAVAGANAEDLIRVVPPG